MLFNACDREPGPPNGVTMVDYELTKAQCVFSEISMLNMDHNRGNCRERRVSRQNMPVVEATHAWEFHEPPDSRASVPTVDLKEILGARNPL